MTRFWPDGQPITVRRDARGQPVHFIWRGQRHPVATIVDRWRVDEAWWQTHTRRAYYELNTTTGLWVIIYHDLLNSEWYLQRLYD